MPLYDYECLSCRHRFELKQHFDDAPVAQCPQCQFKARRVFHSVPVLFKGSGFYSTDHKKGAASYSPDGRKEKEEGEKPKDKVATKAESKGPSESTSSEGDKGGGSD
ncbi:MAG: FmdB family zinc ribbon protein [Dehalococcoidia bacterium]